ncbi:MAG: hypothetical protein K8R39_11925 [Arcobacteraceae bacterium]|nr:hypothetical protein [Arcobacteraceae bacterium]
MAQDVQKAVDIEKLEILIEKGTPLSKALREIGEERSAYVIESIEPSMQAKENTRSCSLANQYSGCMART